MNDSQVLNGDLDIHPVLISGIAQFLGCISIPSSMETAEPQNIISSLNDRDVSVHFHKENLVFTGTDNPMKQTHTPNDGSLYRIRTKLNS